MSKPLGISELIAKIGDENITVQNLGANMSAFNKGKKDCKITFVTSPQMGSQMARAAAGIPSTHIGLVLWIPKDKLPPEPTTASPEDPAPAESRAGT